MSTLMQEMMDRAQKLGVPISVQCDLTYRCNERCEHCYLDHTDYGEMTTAEVCGVIDQLAEAGVFFLSFSGGEVFVRKDFLDIVAYARQLRFDVKVKTNASMIRPGDAERLRELGVRSVQISVYSHRPEIHDAITKLPGSLERTLRGVRLLLDHQLKVVFANVLMRANLGDYAGVKALAAELGAGYTTDPTVTPKMDGDLSILPLGIGGGALGSVFHNPELVGDVDEFCAPPPRVTEDVLDELPCSAGHTACYISPYADVYPCVQFPLACGNVRREKFIDIWKQSPQMQEVRSIHLRDLHVCPTCTHVSSCTRCPGLAYMRGDMRGPSPQDCHKSFVRTGIPVPSLPPPSNLVQLSLGGQLGTGSLLKNQ